MSGACVELGAEGDRAALEGWVAAYGAELERHLTGMLGRVDEARDTLQEVWLTALRAPPDDGPGSNVRAWLYRVATRRALDVLAGDRRRRDLLSRRSRELKADGPNAPDEFVRRLGSEGRARVRAGVARLPRKQRDAVWLRWMEGMEYDAIGRRLGCSPEAARANVYQGVKKLRGDLIELWKREAVS